MVEVDTRVEEWLPWIRRFLAIELLFHRLGGLLDFTPSLVVQFLRSNLSSHFK